MASTPWQRSDSIAQLVSQRLRAQLNLNSPQQGLHQLACEQQSLSGTILALHGVGDPNGSLGPIEDCYIRGSDLVAVYSQAEDQVQRTQVYWHHRESTTDEDSTGSFAENSTGVEMVVSVQTDLLDSLPELESVTRLRAKEVLHLSDPSEQTSESLQQDLTLRASQGPCCIVVRLKDMPMSYVEMEPELDFRELKVEISGDEVSLHHRIFPQRLEKGVILRARVCGVFVPRADDIRTAAHLFRQLNREDLPLTT